MTPPFVMLHLSRFWLRGLFVFLLLFMGLAQAKDYGDTPQQRIHHVLNQTDSISEPEGRFKVRTLSAAGKVLGYVFQSLDVVDIPAYSGKPINVQVILDPAGVILDAYVLEHHEPILLIGIAEEKLHAFSARYSGIKVNQRVVVGHSSDPNAVTVDAIAGATVTAMVVNEVIMRAAHDVAVSLGLVKGNAGLAVAPARVREDIYEPADWKTLTGNGAVRRLHLTRGQVDATFKGTDAEQVEVANAEQADDTFIDLYVTHLNPPTIGRNLLGDAQYRRLMSELKPGEQAIAVMGSGRYSFKGSGYVRGGIFDRVLVRQFGDVISFRDMDFQRLDDVAAEDMPEFDEMAVFIVRASHRFDPGSPWSLELLIRRQTGPVSGIFSSFELAYQLPEPYLERPLPTAEQLAAAEEASRPMWLTLWYQKSVEISVLGVALLVLTAILFFRIHWPGGRRCCIGYAAATWCSPSCFWAAMPWPSYRWSTC